MGKSRKKIVWLVLAAVVIAAAAVIVAQAKNTGQVANWPAQTWTVCRRDITSVTRATGIVKAHVGAEVKVGARVSGVVVKLPIHIGQTVKKGELLARLDDLERNARVSLAQATLRESEAECDYASLDLQRKENLAASRTLSQGELDIARKAAVVAAAKRDQARATCRLAQIDLGYTVLTSPLDGVVSAITTQLGETVVANFAAPTFVTIIDLQRLEVWAYIDETDIGRVTVGQNGRFTVDTYPGESWSGTVSAIYPKPEMQNNVVNYIAVLSITPRPGVVLRPEMTAAVTMLQECRRNVMVVPRHFVQQNQGEDVVTRWLNGGPQRCTVRLGGKDDQYVEVVSGLQIGDTVAAPDERLIP
jgi:HlyD family secretion protein